MNKFPHLLSPFLFRRAQDFVTEWTGQITPDFHIVIFSSKHTSAESKSELPRISYSHLVCEQKMLFCRAVDPA